MTPTDLVELAEIKEQIKARKSIAALRRLNDLALAYPHDVEVRNLITLCNEENANAEKLFVPKSRIGLDHSAPEGYIRFRNPVQLALILFFIIVCAILTSTLIIYLVTRVYHIIY
jgi:hypothetical protein